MAGLRTRYPCRKCSHEADCAWRIRDLRNVVADARLRGMSESRTPEIYVNW